MPYHVYAALDSNSRMETWERQLLVTERFGNRARYDATLNAVRLPALSDAVFSTEPTDNEGILMYGRLTAGIQVKSVLVVQLNMSTMVNGGAIEYDTLSPLVLIVPYINFVNTKIKLKVEPKYNEEAVDVALVPREPILLRTRRIAFVNDTNNPLTADDQQVVYIIEYVYTPQIVN